MEKCPCDDGDDRIAAEVLLHCNIEQFRLHGDTGWYSYMFGSEPCNLPKGKLFIAEIGGQHSDGEIATIYEFFCKGMLRHLETFSVFGGSLTDDGLELISMISSLRFLELENLGKITDRGARQIAKLCNLERLSLNGDSVGDSCIPLFFSLPLLKELDLGWTDVTDLVNFEFDGDFPIQKLVLDGTTLSDNGLARLRYLKNLRVLEVHHTRVTNTGIAQLLSYLPHVRITWGDYPPRK